ncbi:MAG: hypothetical protein AMXMBFR83_14130 [Phycisphaerae bacterium]
MMQGHREHVTRLITSTFVYRTVGGAEVTGGLLLLAPFLSRRIFGTDDYALEFRLISIGALIFSTLSTISLMQWALQRFHWRATCDLISSLLTRLLAVALFFGWGFHGFLVGTIIGGLIAVGLQLYSVRDYLSPRLLPFRPLFRQGAPYMGSDMLRNLLVNLDQPLVAFILGDVALADFFVAKRCYGCFNMALQAMTGPLGAKLSEARVQGTAALTSFFQNSLYLIAILFIPAGFALIGTSGVILRVLVGAKYATAAPILAMYGLALAASCTYELWYEAVVRLQAGSKVIFQNLLLSVVTYGSYFAFLPFLGPVGIPLSAAIAWAAASVVAAYSLRREVGLRCRAGLYVRPMLCGVLVLAAVWPLTWLRQTPATFTLMMAVAGGCYAIGFWLLAPANVRELVRRVWRRAVRFRGGQGAMPQAEGRADAGPRPDQLVGRSPEVDIVVKE